MSYRSAGRRAKVGQVTLTDPTTFITLGLFAAATEPKRQPPKVSAREALAELAADCRHAELRQLMESTR